MGVLLLLAFISNVMFSFLLTLFLVAVPSPGQSPQPDPLCKLCQNIVTDIETWLTSENTMDQIIGFVDQICKVLAAVDPTLGSACTDLEAQLPDIIQYILTENLSPQEVCVCLRSCEGDCIINPSNSTVNTAWSN